MAEVPADILEFRAAADLIRPIVSAFVHRRDNQGRKVVVELLETRPSIQIMLGDAYWVREADASSSWRVAPRIGLWGPRFSWGYGFAPDDINVFAFGLTAAGVERLTGRRARDFVNRIEDLADLSPDLAAELGAMLKTTSGFADRCAAATAVLSRFAPPASEKLPQIVRITARLSATDAPSMPEIAARLGLSDRQMRRLFQEHYGVSPKFFQRVLRFERALQLLHPNPWESSGALEPGAFSDQSHMIREFMALIRMTPRQYALRKATGRDLTLRSVAVEGIAPPPGLAAASPVTGARQLEVDTGSSARRALNV